MIINRLNKTKEEREVDLAAEREARDASMRQEKKHIAAEQVITCCLWMNSCLIIIQRRKEKETTEKRRAEADMRSYSSIMKTEKMKSNKIEDGKDIDDDFM